VTIFLTVLHVMVSVVLIVVVLLQHGKGADIGAVFGGGASTTVFGSRGAGNFLTKLTTGSALVFMVTSLSLAYLSNRSATQGIFEDRPAAPAAPATPGPAPAEQPAPAEAPSGGFEEVKPAKPGEPQAAAEPEAKAPAAPEAPPASAPAPTDGGAKP
jgi:preprotein translocase subunit SecG